MNLRERLGHIIQHAQAAEREWDAMQSPANCTCHPDEATVPCQRKYAHSDCMASWRQTVEAIAAALTDGNPLHLPFSEQWRIPEVAEKIAGLFGPAEAPSIAPAPDDSLDAVPWLRAFARLPCDDPRDMPGRADWPVKKLYEIADGLDRLTRSLPSAPAVPEALAVPEVWSQEERDGMAAAFAAADGKHGHYETLFSVAAWLLRHRAAKYARTQTTAPPAALPPEVAALVKRAQQVFIASVRKAGFSQTADLVRDLADLTTPALPPT